MTARSRLYRILERMEHHQEEVRANAGHGSGGGGVCKGHLRQRTPSAQLGHAGHRKRGQKEVREAGRSGLRTRHRRKLQEGWEEGGDITGIGRKTTPIH